MIQVGWSSFDGGRFAARVAAEHEAPRTLWWETTAGDGPVPPTTADALAVAVVPMAMAYRQDLHLEGRVSHTLLAGIEEFVDAWSLWRPDRFGRIAVTADEVVDDRTATPGPLAAVCALSGGVDGTYAAYAHRTGLLGHRSLPLAAAVLVHGFDIAPDDHAGFAAARSSAGAICEELDIPLVCVRTNWREQVDPDWQMTFGAAVLAVLHLFSARAGHAVLAADTTYRSFALPWGSNPVTNGMLSSAQMQVHSVGGGVTRTAKCAAIGSLGSVRAHLRVCWASPTPGRNCGSCEKCVRTKANFLAAAVGEVPALGPLHPGELRSVRIGSDAARRLLEELRSDATALPPAVADELEALLDGDA